MESKHERLTELNPHSKRHEQSRDTGDEASQPDFWRALVKYRWMVAVAVTIGLVTGLGVAFQKPRQYAYSTTIRIGIMIENERPGHIEPTETTLAKLTEIFIPQVLRDYENKHQNSGQRYEIKARNQRNLKWVILQSEGSADEQETYVALQQAVLDLLKQDHHRFTSVSRSDGEAKRTALKDGLEELTAQSKSFSAEMTRLDKDAVLLREEIARIKDTIAGAKQHRQRIEERSLDAIKAMSLLVIGEERLYLVLDRKRDELAEKLVANQRAQVYQRQLMAGLEAHLSYIQETDAIAPPMRSLRPVGPGRSIIVILATLLGLLVGIFSVFFIELVSKSRVRTRRSAANSL